MKKALSSEWRHPDVFTNVRNFDLKIDSANLRTDLSQCILENILYPSMIPAIIDSIPTVKS